MIFSRISYIVIDEISLLGVRRSVLVQNNGESDYNTSLILAAERTNRRDPLDHSNYYKGGWNISDEHYFAVSISDPRLNFIPF